MGVKGERTLFRRGYHFSTGKVGERTMRKHIGARFWGVLLGVVLIGAIFVPQVSADKSGGSWIDSFDQWVEPRDMSMYNKEIIIEEPNYTMSPEEVERTPGLVVLDKNASLCFFESGMKIDSFQGYTVHLTAIDDSAEAVEPEREDDDDKWMNWTTPWRRSGDAMEGLSSLSELCMLLTPKSGDGIF
ncbi:hypothetical protein J2129_000154 [Methanofollis sp. W23]|uniref:hypothetical protein n=1 Tax=Methanofollis sp. W23 TaxID=2817849 RepID=UPI001AE3261C|nr:hypothetical protein [Methanofollis sp. W23]MBP2144700.1 hypothetical protein [Methanofollis sp. W23]